MDGLQLYSGIVSHHRLRPVKHGFAYHVFHTLLDIDQLNCTFNNWWPLTGYNRTALISFQEDVHLRGIRAPGQSLSSAVRDFLESRLGKRPLGKILLLTNLSYFGYCFNPVSFYYIYDDSNKKVETIIAEVTNTPWNEQHCYVLNPAADGVEMWDEYCRRDATDPHWSVGQLVNSPSIAAALDSPSRPPISSTRIAAAGTDLSSAVVSGDAKPTITPPEQDEDPTDLIVSPSPTHSASTCTNIATRLPHPSRATADDCEGQTDNAANGATTPEAQVPATASHTSDNGRDESKDGHMVRRLHARWRKSFFVSPFMSVNDQEYRWIFTEPNDILLIQSQSIRGLTTRSQTASATISSASLPMAASNTNAVSASAVTASSVSSACLSSTALSVSAAATSTSTSSASSSSSAAAAAAVAPFFYTQVRYTRYGSISATLFQLLKCIASTPLITLQIQLWIHWEAFQLYWKGVELYSNPSGTKNTFTNVVETLMDAVVWCVNKATSMFSTTATPAATLATAAADGAATTLHSS